MRADAGPERARQVHQHGVGDGPRERLAGQRGRGLHRRDREAQRTRGPERGGGALRGRGVRGQRKRARDGEGELRVHGAQEGRGDRGGEPQRGQREQRVVGRTVRMCCRSGGVRARDRKCRALRLALAKGAVVGKHRWQGEVVCGDACGQQLHVAGDGERGRLHRVHDHDFVGE